MDYQTVLDDLKARFGDKRLLTPEDIAPLIGVSEKAQANQRIRGTFPIPLLPQGPKSRKIIISIYDLARHVAGREPVSNPQPKQFASQPEPAASGADPASKATPEKKSRVRKKKADAGKRGASAANPKMKASEVPFHPGRPPLGPF